MKSVEAEKKRMEGAEGQISLLFVCEVFLLYLINQNWPWMIERKVKNERWSSTVTGSPRGCGAGWPVTCK